jgi:hypothetical protein
MGILILSSLRIPPLVSMPHAELKVALTEIPPISSRFAGMSLYRLGVVDYLFPEFEPFFSCSDSPRAQLNFLTVDSPTRTPYAVSRFTWKVSTH